MSQIPAFGALLPILGVVLASAAFPAQADTEDPNVLLDRGQVVQACAALKVPNVSDNPDSWFARGRCAALGGDHESAIHWFSKILAVASAGRTQLELARSLAKAGRSSEARQAYEAVLQSMPPQTIRDWVAVEVAALDGVQERRFGRWRFGFSPVRDSNVNVGPVNRSIMLFDLPFELNDASVARSDTGLVGWVGVEVPQVTSLGQVTWAAREEATFYRTADFANLKHLNVSASLVHAGTLAQWTWAVSVDRQSQRSGNRANTLVGSAQAFVPLGLSANVSWASSIQLDIGRAASQAAQASNTMFSTFRAISPALHARMSNGVELLAGPRWSDERASDRSRAHHDRGWQLSAQGQLEAVCKACGWAISQASIASGYGAIDPLFGVVRSDHMQVRSLKMFGSAENEKKGVPAYAFFVESSRNRSNLSLYEYRRLRLVLSSEWTF